MTIFVLGRKWVVTVYADKTYYKKFGSDSHGICVIDDKKIFIRRSSIKIDTVIHELIHAYAAELSLVELELDDDQVEEFFCELFARNGTAILESACEVVKHYMN